MSAKLPMGVATRYRLPAGEECAPAAACAACSSKGRCGALLAAVQALAVLALVLSAAVALAAVWAGGVGVFTWGAIRLWVCLGSFASV